MGVSGFRCLGVLGFRCVGSDWPGPKTNWPTSSKNCENGASNEIKTKLACILEARGSTRLRMGEFLPNYYEDHIAGKGDNSLQHDNFVHKFIPMPQAMKIPAAKAKQRWTRNGKNWRKFRRGT